MVSLFRCDCIRCVGLEGRGGGGGGGGGDGGHCNNSKLDELNGSSNNGSGGNNNNRKKKKKRRHRFDYVFQHQTKDQSRNLDEYTKYYTRGLFSVWSTTRSVRTQRARTHIMTDTTYQTSLIASGCRASYKCITGLGLKILVLHTAVPRCNLSFFCTTSPSVFPNCKHVN